MTRLNRMKIHSWCGPKTATGVYFLFFSTITKVLLGVDFSNIQVRYITTAID